TTQLLGLKGLLQEIQQLGRVRHHHIRVDAVKSVGLVVPWSLHLDLISWPQPCDDPFLPASRLLYAWQWSTCGRRDLRAYRCGRRRTDRPSAFALCRRERWLCRRLHPRFRHTATVRLKCCPGSRGLRLAAPETRRRA